MTSTLAGTDKSIFCKLHHRKLPVKINMHALSSKFSELKSASILGSNSSIADNGRFSYWASEPKEIFEFNSGQGNPFEKLEKILSKYHLDKDSTSILPDNIFCGGWIGFFGYELCKYIERLPNTTIDDLQMPLIRLCFYDKVIAYDHVENACWLFILEIPGDSKSPEQKLDELEYLIDQSQQIDVTCPARIDLNTIDFSQVICNMSKNYYLEAFERIKDERSTSNVQRSTFNFKNVKDWIPRPSRRMTKGRLCTKNVIPQLACQAVALAKT